MHAGAYLFGEPGSQDDFTHKLTTEVSRSVQLLPALALELCRVGQLMPEAAGITPAPHEPGDPLHGLRQTGDHVQQLSGIKNNIANAVGIMLVVDGAAAIATAASAFLGVGVVAVGGHVALRAHYSGTYNRAVNTLAGIKDAHATHYKAHFREIMGKARDSLRLHLEAGFRLNERVMRLDRVARALAQAQSLRDDIAGAASPIALFYDA